jgi:6,7-dimethyl-8-ribityllumazine synthase
LSKDAAVTGVGRVFAGSTDARGLRIALAASRFHGPMVERLVEGAANELARLGAQPADVDLAWAPGAFELPYLAQTLARTGRYDAIVTLGVVIRGETPHFDYVCAEAARGIAEVARAEGVPVLFGVITAEDPAQAHARAGGVSNKGQEVARAAVEFVTALREAR